jgi:chromosome partitioning protein
MVGLERSWNASGVAIALAGFDRLLVDVVLLDAPPNLGALSVAVIRLSTALLIPLIPEPDSIGVIETLLATIQAVNPDAEILGVIPTLYDGRRKLTEDVLGHIREQFPRLPILTPVPRLLALAETPLHGRSVIESAPRSSAAEAYRAIAKEINRAPIHA